MDPFTHAAFGAISARLLPFAKRHKPSWILAGMAAVSPDLDLMIPYQGNIFEKQALHRFFTHTLLLLPIEACALSWAFGYLTAGISFQKRYALACLGIFSHIFLDVLTSGGLPFLWPFTYHRFSADLLPMVDFVFFGILLLTFSSMWRDKRFWSRAGGLFACVYLMLAGVQKERAIYCQQELACQRHHQVEASYVLPSPGNILLWRSIYEHQGSYYVDGMRLGLSPVVCTGGSLRKATLETTGARKGTVCFYSCSIFFWMARGCVAVVEPGVYANLCYSLLPQATDLVLVMEVKRGTTPSGATWETCFPQFDANLWKARLQRDGRAFFRLLWSGELLEKP
ncbi:MAG: metal-dependent hydrolase [Holosporales bacterium]|jgi:inner membrane protein|nr:metal-dependent hydrolase [Holosporales bacterium]